MSDEDREAFVWRAHSYINDYIRLADAKAGALFAVFGAVVGLLIRQWTDGDEPMTWWRMALFSSALLSSAIVLVLAIDVVRPRTRKSDQGYIFWEHINDRRLREYQDALRGLDAGGLFDAVTSHTHEISAIADMKYARLKLAFVASYVALPLGLLGLPTL